VDQHLITIEKETNVRSTPRELVIQAKGTARGGMFNPSEMTLQKTVHWPEGGGRRRGHPRLSFNGGASRTLTLSLFFDTYEEGGTQRDVRVHTNKLTQLARYDGDRHRPPVCLISWGPHLVGADLPFRGVVTSLTQKFTLFLSNGTPVRATVDVTFREYEAPGRQERNPPTNSPDQRKTRVVNRGDSLWAIAAAEYDDPTRWRPIAQANNLDNPRALVPGMTLVIPALE
jgi:hypothetical protein